MSNNGWNNAFSKVSNSVEETQYIAIEWSKILNAGDIVILNGDLGAGKTAFVKGIAEGIGYPQDNVQSPTFSYLHIYEGKKHTLFHFDLYRLQGIDDFLSLGFDDFLHQKGICCIEWAERITALLPQKLWTVNIKTLDANSRLLEISYG